MKYGIFAKVVTQVTEHKDWCFSFGLKEKQNMKSCEIVIFAKTM